MAEEKHSSSRASSGMGGHKKSKHKSAKKPHSVHVRRGKSGGFIAEHHHLPDEDGTVSPTEEHVLPDIQSLQAHMADNMGDQGSVQQAPPDASAQTAPPATAGMQQPGM